MLSRIAESLYWLARYVERADNVARLLDDAFHLELDAGFAGADGANRPLDGILTILGCRDAYATAAETGGDDVPHFLVFDRTGLHSILAMVAQARANARTTQEALSAEAWSQLNRLYLALKSPRAPAKFQASPARFLARVQRECTLFTGLIDGTLSRTEPFHFLRVGRYVERVDMLSRILGVHLRSGPGAAGGPEPGGAEESADRPEHLVYWASLLRSCSAYEAYLKQRRDRLDAEGVLGHLLLEEDFPRSMRFAVARGLESLRAVAGGGGSSAERRLGRLDGELRYMDVREALQRGVSAFLTEVQEGCNQVGREIQLAYFLT
jgi:uncharacterized alpha-E superfamily protein